MLLSTLVFASLQSAACSEKTQRQLHEGVAHF